MRTSCLGTVSSSWVISERYIRALVLIRFNWGGEERDREEANAVVTAQQQQSYQQVELTIIKKVQLM